MQQKRYIYRKGQTNLICIERIQSRKAMTSCAQSHLGDSRSPCEQIMRLCALRRLDINIRQILDGIAIYYCYILHKKLQWVTPNELILNAKRIKVRLLEKKLSLLRLGFKPMILVISNDPWRDVKKKTAVNTSNKLAN